jgi:hypothetical protein
MRRLSPLASVLAGLAIALPARAQVVSNFSNYSSPFTTEFQAAVGRPVTSGVLDFYDTELFVAGARNVLGTWGTSSSDPGSVNRPTNAGGSTTMFATQLGEEVDIFGRGSDIVLGIFQPFSLFSIDVGHLYSPAYAPITLAPITLTFFGFGPSTGNATIQQVFTIPVPTAVGGVQRPLLQTLTFDSRWSAMSNVWWFQSGSSATANQFSNAVATLTPEPSTYVFTLTGLVGLGLIGRRKRLSSRTDKLSP